MLAESGIPVRVWGTNWHKLKKKNELLKLEETPVHGAEYARALCSFDINLGFLRKYARDLQTTRSVEIPACGAFMLAERTNEHRSLFEEGREAEFFESDEELLGKVRYYLEHPEERVRIALAGRERCVTGRYSNHDRLSALLARVEAIRSEA
jgi:spore maturation protein CgeB